MNVLCSYVGNCVTKRTVHVFSVKRYSTKPALANNHKKASIESKDIRDVRFLALERVTVGKRTSLELVRNIVVLSICSFPGLADNALKVFKIAQKCLGKRMFSAIVKRSMYAQFVGGDGFEEIQAVVQRLRRENLHAMLAVPIEEIAERPGTTRQELASGNMQKIKNCIDLAHDLPGNEGEPRLMQIKLTAILDSLILGEISRKLQLDNVKNLATWIENGCNGQYKELEALAKNQVVEFSEGIRKLNSVFQYAATKEVTVLVDAEYTWINPALNLITLAMMRVYNKNSAVIWNTYQAYLKATRNTIIDHARICHDDGIHFGFKIVRGAYLHSETVKMGGHPEYICDSWADTNQNYNECFNASLRLDPDLTQIMMATHNETSVELGVGRILESRDSGAKPIDNVVFGQVYGMADYISCTLGAHEFTIHKSIPYGSIDDTIPYLCRRVEENRTFFKGLTNERRILHYCLRQNFLKAFKRGAT